MPGVLQRVAWLRGGRGRSPGVSRLAWHELCDVGKSGRDVV